jgi:hypothetical protein
VTDFDGHQGWVRIGHFFPERRLIKKYFAGHQGWGLKSSIFSKGGLIKKFC